ncbi:MAG: response regulator [Proteobacteria bacterium]|nr:response regulator [Pseudomonadota bacterium]NOG61087.1 response regulator [Pseudomonadota bacterium]
METEVRSILIIDDDLDYRKALLVRLNSLFPDAKIEEYDFPRLGCPPLNFDWEKYDVLILDYYLSKNETGLGWFSRYKKSENFPATIVITGMDDNKIAKRVLKAGVHHFLSKKHLTKGEMYNGIEKALAVRASIIKNYKKQSDHENNFDTFINNSLQNTEERLFTKILNIRNTTGCIPDRQLIDSEIERERDHILKSIDYVPAQEAKIGLLEIAADRIRNMSW